MKLATLAILLILFCNSSLALVNMRNGSYAEKWIDVVSPGSGYDLRIERFYSSRSLFNGLFGFGWCSQLETELQHRSDGVIVLSECGGGIEVTYYPKNFDPKSPNQTVDKIISYFKRKNKSLSKSYLKKLRTQLISDTKQRFELANKLLLLKGQSLQKRKDVYISQAKGLEEIDFNGRYYVRKNHHNGSVEKFNLKGQIAQMIDKMGNWIKFNYAQDKIAYIVDNKGRRLNFLYDRAGHLSRIHDGQKLDVKYTFNAGNLVKVKNAWGNTYDYDYDDQHNMTKVTFPPVKGKPEYIRLTYDRANDWIKTYTDRDGCHQNFDFIMSQKDPKNHYWSNVTTSCDGGKTMSSGHFEYWYKNFEHSKLKYLSRALDDQNKVIKDTYFHPYLGRPVSIHDIQPDRSSMYSGFAYKPNGLVHEKEAKIYTFNKKRELDTWERTFYKYNMNIRKMSETLTNYLNKSGKPIMKTKTSFQYDKRGLLGRAKQSSGIYVDVKYNSSGKIEKLTDHKKVSITFKYDDINTKPINIKHSRHGEIKIAYDANGDIDDVSSQKGRNIASSVIQELLEFLKVLGPAAEEELKL